MSTNEPVNVGDRPASVFRQFLDMPNDRPIKTLAITLIVALVCSALVTASAVILKPRQIANREAERQRHIVDIVSRVPDFAAAFSRGEATLEAKVVDLESGEYVPRMDPASFDQRAAAKDPETSVMVDPKEDVAWVGRRAKFAVVYLLVRAGKTEVVVLPVRGKGYGSMLYGYLGVSADLKTVVGLTFYEHTETPGLGALIDAPSWRRQWYGKRIWDQTGTQRLGIATGPVDPASPDAAYQVDGLTGATWTSHGVTNLLRYWLGDHGFGPFLRKLRAR
ncbi:MAG: Na(+)-translocating NADH-quinone reductase subunit C [Rhodospirillaceae bacterium]|jgi:Na+-transporting NADH:ubiquinone oxidoreductase subunit C|nr:Na(+)-translocating NADH-quinone reductase subunit C [Rhodospirillaceae bacterium]MBT6139747.1 Na(+)-translocating NADH-quinone reductase subunit C [Rhodospirillaceae bacterium]